MIAVVRRRSKQPAALPTGDRKMYMFDKAWFVDDSGLGQAGESSTRALQHATDGSGLMYYYFLGLERRPPRARVGEDGGKDGGSARGLARGSARESVRESARRAARGSARESNAEKSIEDRSREVHLR